MILYSIFQNICYDIHIMFTMFCKVERSDKGKKVCT